MSIQLTIIEKRLNGIESALTYLSTGLSSAFPTAGIPFESISNGLVELHNDIENYKADRVASKRSIIFDRHTMISRDDLRFLVGQYTRTLADVEDCDRVTSVSNSSDHYEIDLSNLPLNDIVDGLSNANLISHRLILHVGLRHGVDIQIQETATVDMESTTYTTKYDPTIHPLIKFRVVNWFYSQLAKHVGSSAWCLPTPCLGEHVNRNLTVKELKMRPHIQLLEHLTGVAERFMRWADDNGVVSYGVGLSVPSGVKSTSTVMQVIVSRVEDTGEVTVLLRDYDRREFVSPRVNVQCEFPISNPSQGVDYEDFVKTLETLPMSRLSRLHTLTSSLRFFEPTVNDTTISDFDGVKYTVEWIVGNQKESVE